MGIDDVIAAAISLIATECALFSYIIRTETRKLRRSKLPPLEIPATDPSGRMCGTS